MGSYPPLKGGFLLGGAVSGAVNTRKTPFADGALPSIRIAWLFSVLLAASWSFVAAEILLSLEGNASHWPLGLIFLSVLAILTVTGFFFKGSCSAE
jgi:hypothetical protein